MDIDLSPLEPAMMDIFWMVVKVLGIPFIISIIVGLILEFLKVPLKLVRFIAIIIFLLLFYQMLMNIE